MKGYNHLLLSNDSVLEALQDYLEKHSAPGITLEAVSWGIRNHDGKDLVHVEFEQFEPPKVQP